MKMRPQSRGGVQSYKVPPARKQRQSWARSMDARQHTGDRFKITATTSTGVPSSRPFGVSSPHPFLYFTDLKYLAEGSTLGGDPANSSLGSACAALAFACLQLPGRGRRVRRAQLRQADDRLDTGDAWEMGTWQIKTPTQSGSRGKEVGG